MDVQLAESIRELNLNQLSYEHPMTLKVLEEVPEGRLGWKPHEKSRPFGELFHHIYDAAPWFSSILENGKVSFDGPGDRPAVPATKAELLGVCTKLNDEFVARMKALKGDQLVAMIPFGNAPAMPAVLYMGWYLHHLIHHRGQLTVYLRSMGARVPSIYGGSADYPFSM